MPSKLKIKLYKIFQDPGDSNFIERFIGKIFFIIVLLNIIGLLGESNATVNLDKEATVGLIKMITVFLFAIEYIIRLYISDLTFPNVSKPKALFKYMTSFLGIVDLFAIIPVFMFFSASNSELILLSQISRLLTMFKLVRYSLALKTIARVIKEKKEELLITVVLMIFIMILSSTLIYYFEHTAQPEKFYSVLASFWWAVETLTTVGYGDVYPITVGGKILASIIAISGIGLVALPTGIISSGFMFTIKKDKACPHCGKTIE